jgi:hypothetical protein
LQAEAAHFAKIKGGPVPVVEESLSEDVEIGGGVKRALENGTEGEEDHEAKRRRVLEETRDIDAESDEEDNSEDDRLVGFIFRYLEIGVERAIFGLGHWKGTFAVLRHIELAVALSRDGMRRLVVAVEPSVPFWFKEAQLV